MVLNRVYTPGGLKIDVFLDKKLDFRLQATFFHSLNQGLPPQGDRKCSEMVRFGPILDGFRAPAQKCSEKARFGPILDGFRAPGQKCSEMVRFEPILDGFRAPAEKCSEMVRFEPILDGFAGCLRPRGRQTRPLGLPLPPRNTRSSKTTESHVSAYPHCASPRSHHAHEREKRGPPPGFLENPKP